MRIKHKTVPLSAWLAWMENWAMLLNAGLPTLESLAFGLEHIDQTSRTGKRLANKLHAVYAALKEGTPLTQAFTNHAPDAPPALQLALVCGQAHGDLGGALTQQVAHCKHNQALHTALLKSLAYPACVLAMALVAWAMLVFFTPNMATFSTEPKGTAGVASATQFSLANALLGFGLAGMLGLGGLWIRSHWTKQPALFPQHLGRFNPKGPAVVAEVFFVWSVQLAAGLDWLQCLAQTQAQPCRSGSKKLHHDILLFCMQLQRAVLRGLTVSQAMAAAQAPPFMVQQAELAEQTGRLDRCFLLLYYFYDAKAKQRLQRLNAFLGPCTLLLAALVLGLAFSTTLAPLYGDGHGFLGAR